MKIRDSGPRSPSRGLWLLGAIVLILLGPPLLAARDGRAVTDARVRWHSWRLRSSDPLTRRAARLALLGLGRPAVDSVYPQLVVETLVDSVKYPFLPCLVVESRTCLTPTELEALLRGERRPDLEQIWVAPGPNDSLGSRPDQYVALCAGLDRKRAPIAALLRKDDPLFPKVMAALERAGLVRAGRAE